MIGVWLAVAATPDSPNLHVSVHLSQADAYEALRENYADEVALDDHLAIEGALEEQPNTCSPKDWAVCIRPFDVAEDER